MMHSAAARTKRLQTVESCEFHSPMAKRREQRGAGGSRLNSRDHIDRIQRPPHMTQTVAASSSCSTISPLGLPVDRCQSSESPCGETGMGTASCRFGKSEIPGHVLHTRYVESVIRILVIAQRAVR